MTFNATKPNASESPSLAPGQIQTNWSRLQTIIDKDHQFNASAATNDGLHKRVSLMNGNQASLPAGSNAVMYSNSVSLSTGVTRNEVFVRNASQNMLLAPRAACSFTVSGTTPTIEFSFNVNTVVRNSIGVYTITFTGALPSAKYAAFSMAQPSFGGGIAGNTLIMQYGSGTPRTTTQLSLDMRDAAGALRDPVICSVFVFGG